jgi:hypothetical protein
MTSLLRSAAVFGLLAALSPFSSGTTLTVNATTTVRTVDERVFGVNTNIWDSYLNTPETIALLKAANVRFLRFPGGSLSDEYHWKTNTTLANTWTWASNTDGFLNVAAQTGAKVVMTANYGTGTPAEAAEWVTYCNVTKSAGFKYWEIGNENYGSWEADAQARKNDPLIYATRAKDYIAQMKAADSTIKVGIVVSSPNEDYATYTDHPVTNSRTGIVQNGWNAVMLTNLKTLGVTPDFVALHRYDGAPNAENDAALLQKAQTWPDDIAKLRQQLTDYLGTAAASVEILVTENNSVYSKPGKQTTSLVNALFLADSFCNVLKTEVNAVNWWGLRNGQDKTNNLAGALYGWRAYGDYGILSTPSTFGSSTAYDTYPTYYAFKILSLFARQGDRIVSVASDNSLLSAFGCIKADGTLRLLVINKSPTAIQSSAITLTGFTPAATATTYTYGIPEDEAARTGSGSKDIQTASITNASTSFTTSFEPYSLSVLSFTAGTSVPPVRPPVTPPVTPPSSGGGGGGGAVSLGTVAALAALGLARRLARRN